MIISLNIMRIDVHDAMRNYFVILPLVPILVHLAIYTAFSLFIFIYQVPFRFVTAVSNEVLEAGPKVTFPTVLSLIVALMTLIWSLF